MTSRPADIRLTEAGPLAGESFREDLIEGLSQPQKTIPCKYLYDERGSALFERICELDEYYLTRAELQIVQRHAMRMARALGPRCALIEPGIGSGLKTRLLLEVLSEPAAFIPIDISRQHLLRSVEELAERFPHIEMLPVCADFSAAFDLPEPSSPADRRAVFFPGSTIGNFHAGGRAALLRRMADLAGEDGRLIIGIDLRKDRRTLEAAYNDREGVTRRFNLNLLVRANREADADFDPDGFEHLAFYNADRGRIEIHLLSRNAQTVRIGGRRFDFEQGETILTEHSYKFTVDGFTAEAAAAGWSLRHVWPDEADRFAVLGFARKPDDGESRDAR